MPAFPALLEPAVPPAFLERPDWTSLGLVMSVLGSFLLANAILFRHPRKMVAELFRGEKRELRPIREYIFHRVQVTLGFLYLLAGFSLQLLGRHAAADGEPRLSAAWIGAVVLSAVVLEVLGWVVSQALFRHYVRGYLMKNPFDFATEVKLAREVGELLGLKSKSDETVQSYVARLRQRLGILEPGRRAEGERRPPAGRREPARFERVAAADEERR